MLPGEMPKSWPLEALKAQAVAARTYAVKTTMDRRDKGSDFDLYSTVSDQVYYGISAQSKRTDKAVDSTRGLIVTYKGKPIYAFYSADCGGRTQNGNLIFSKKLKGKTYPYLMPVACPYKGRGWTVTLSYWQILKACYNLGYRPKRILTVEDIGDYLLVNASEKGRKVTYKVYKPRFRSATGYALKGSRYFLKVCNAQGDCTFEGRGIGHGVGLCQHGARVMAERGASFSKILEHYYPKTKLVLIYKVFR